MFDVIAKRRWFYLISLAFTIPGLFFILLTPFTDAGLQFTIDYTGGTKWEIRFEDPNVTPDQVEAVFASKGLEATAITHRLGLHRDQDREAGRLPRGRPLGRRRARAPRRAPARQRQPGGQLQRGTVGQPIREPERVTGSVRVARAVRLARGLARPIRIAAARHRQHGDPDPGNAR